MQATGFTVLSKNLSFTHSVKRVFFGSAVESVVCAKNHIQLIILGLWKLYKKSPITIKLIFQQHWNSFLAEYKALVTWYMTYNVWKIMNCREPDGLGFSTFSCPVHPSEIRHVHVHIIVSAGGLKLSGKAERYTRFEQRKQQNPKARMKKVSVLTNNPEWIPWTKFPYQMLQKRYQALLIKHLKQQIDRNINSETPNQELIVFSDLTITKTFFDDLKKEYQNGFYVHINKERTDLKLTAAYIGRYARRLPLSEIRLKNYTGGRERQTDFQGKDPLLCNICQTVMVFVAAHIPSPLILIRVKLQSAFS